MIQLVSVNYDDPQGNPNCQLTLRLTCEPTPTNGESALDNAQAFVERLKILVGTPLGYQLATDSSDGSLLAETTKAYLISQAELRGREQAKATRSKPLPKKRNGAKRRQSVGIR